MTADENTVDMILLFTSFLGLLCGSSSEVVPYNEQYFDQYVDHFNFGSYGEQKFKQRYLIQDKWWDRHGPILFYTGNEGDITEFWDNTGFMFDIAPEFRGLVVFAEHRFYGKSLPFGVNDSFIQPYIGLLTIEQAMADFAVLLTNLKESLNATRVPVIAFGGSYGGMLSAWMRFKYPNVITGAIAASAPIFLVDPHSSHDFFFEDVTRDFAAASPTCEDKVRKAFHLMNNLAAQGQRGLKKLSALFHLCNPLSCTKEYTHLQGWIRNSFTDLAMMDYPYPSNNLAKLPAFPVKVACEYIDNSTDVIEGLARAAGLFYNGTSGSSKCFNIFEEFVECADPTGCGIGLNSFSWDYQACTEVRLPDGSNNITDMFPAIPFTSDMRNKYCQQRWNVTPRDDWGTIQFWGKNIKTASNIVFSNGDLDPWRRGGVVTSPNPRIKTILIKDGAHHLDLRGRNSADPQSVTNARNEEKAEIRKWIEEHERMILGHSGIPSVSLVG